MTIAGKRLTESAGMVLIGDAVLGLARPAEHCLLWRGGPQWWRNTIDWFAEHPQVTRTLAAAELAIGLWISIDQEPSSASAERAVAMK